MAELPFLPGLPILQVAGLKFLSRNEAMRSLLGHLGKDSFQTFRGFKPPLVCPLQCCQFFKRAQVYKKMGEKRAL